MSALNYEEVIDTCEWEPHKPEGQPHTYQRLRRRRYVAEVYADLRKALGADEYGGVNHPGLEEYFTLASGMTSQSEWPEGRIAVFAVNGTSEGDYVHVAVLGETAGGTPTFWTLLLGKTFQGRDAAWAAARRIADLLGA